MAGESNVLRNAPQFSEKGEEVYRTVSGLQAGDQRIERLARRVARAVTAYDAGNISYSSPLDKFLLCGTLFSAIPLLVQSIAETWLGKPWDGTPSFTYIDCNAFNAFNMVYPGMLVPLVGPIPQDSMEFQASPLLAQIDVPHFKVRRGDDLKLLQEWNKSFQKKWSFEIGRLGPNALEFYRRFNFLIAKFQQELYEKELQERGPFGSVIFFDGIDRASQPLQELVLQILGGGSLQLANGMLVDFSHSIVIMSVYLSRETLRRGANIGFLREAASKDASSDTKTRLRFEYNKVRQGLLERNETAAVTQSVAENLIIVGERTRYSQRQRVNTELEKVARRCRDYGLELTFTPRLVDGLVDDSLETVIDDGAKSDVYTEERLVSGIKRHILGALHRLVLSGKLCVGTSLTFDCLPQKNSKEKNIKVSVVMTVEGKGEILTPTKIRSRESTVQESTSPALWPEWLTELDDKARNLLNTLSR